jgi:hypothetical protein
MARLSTMVRDKKTGRKRRKDVTRSRAAKKGARKRKGRHLKATTKLKMKRSAAITRRTGRTKAGRRSLIKRGVGRPAKKRGRGRPPGIPHTAATKKKMAASHRARWKAKGASYRKAHKSRTRARHKR